MGLAPNGGLGGLGTPRIICLAALAGLLTLAAPGPSASAAVQCGGKKATIKGTAAGETLKGTRKADVIAAKGGDDTVKGRGGNDRICGGAGNDTLRGEAGNDKLFGEAGDDHLDDQAGANVLDGGDGSDECLGAPGDQLLNCEPRLYVSALTGSDANPGTRGAPLATIGQAILAAVAHGGPVDVIVGEGSYAEDVTLSEGVSLRGGHDCAALPCSWARDPDASQSTIVNQDFDGVVAAAGVTRATKLDGFTVEGKDGAPAPPAAGAAITLSGGSPAVSSSRILGGDMTAGQSSYAVFAFAAVAAPGPLIEENEILAGDSPTGGSWGIEAGSAIEIDSNLINVDQANVGICGSTVVPCGGIRSDSSAAVITNNVIFGAQAARSAAVLIGEFETPAQTLRVNANHLDGGGRATVMASTSSAAILLLNGSCNTCGANAVVGRIRNNLLLGGRNQSRFGIREDAPSGRTIRPEVIENNDFFFPPLGGTTDVMYRRFDGAMNTDYTSTAAINVLTTPPAADNFSADCLVDPSFHLGAGSPCINAGTATEAPPTDFDGQARSIGGVFDVGPDEAG